MRFIKLNLYKVMAVFLLIAMFNFPGIEVFAASDTAFAATQKMADAIIMHIGKPQAYVNNTKTYIDEKNTKVIPIISSNRLLVPIRFISESLGAEVKWDNRTNTATIILNGKTIKLKEKSNKLQVDGKTVSLDVSVINKNQRLFVPTRAISEAFGRNVFYYKDLIVISPGINALNASFDIQLINEINTWFTEAGHGPITGGNELTIKQIDTYESSVVTIKSVDQTGEFISQGSGFCVGSNLFLTNYHVIEGGKLFWIYTNDGKEHEVAGVVKYDEKLDLAILKTKNSISVSPLELGSKSMVEKGDGVVVIGSPEGFENTLSDGIVSSFRNMDGVDFIQMTTPITHGSSGSPLFNMQGYVIGVNTLASDSGNLNFAIAIDYAVNWVFELSRISFNQILVIDMKAALFDSSIDDNEVKRGVYDSFKALQNENVNDYKRVVLPLNPEYGLIDNALSDIFKKYDLKYNIEKIRVIKKRNDESRVEVLYAVVNTNGSDYRDRKILGEYSLKKLSDEWRISNSEENIIEYMENGYSPEISQGRLYYPDGKLSYEGGLFDGLQQGSGKWYNEDGKLQYDGEWMYGVWNGKGKVYNQQGIVTYEGDLKWNTFFGYGKEYYPDGHLSYEGSFIWGEYDGEGKKYDIDGNLVEQGTWAQGGLIQNKQPYFNVTTFNLTVTDFVMNPSKHIAYLLDKEHWKLYSLDILTGKTSTVSFLLPPLCMTVKDDEVYVGLQKGEQVGEQVNYHFSPHKTGAIAIVDADKLTLKDQFNVGIDPYDIAVSPDGYIYISSGSGQSTVIQSFSRKTEQEEGSAQIRQKSIIKFNSTFNRIYAMDTDLSPRDYRNYAISGGSFIDTTHPSGVDSIYHGDYTLDEFFELSPDGRYLFNGSGVIFSCGADTNSDMKYVNKLDREFTDIAFDNEKNKFYIIDGNSNTIYIYDYKTFKNIGSIETSGFIEAIDFNSDGLAALTLIGGKFHEETIIGR